MRANQAMWLTETNILPFPFQRFVDLLMLRPHNRAEVLASMEKP